MIAKLMAHGRDRAEAIARMKRCLDVTVVEGIKTNIPLHRRILDDPDFVAGRLDTALHGALHAAEEGERGLVRPGGPRGTRRSAARVAPAAAAARAASPCCRTSRRRCRCAPTTSATSRVDLPARCGSSPRGSCGEGRLAALEPLRLRGVLPAAGALPAGPAARAVAEPRLRLVAADAAPARSPRSRAYWLARELGASRPGAFLAGAVYALGGFALSCLNLYVFLQALALAPFVAGLLRRAALRRRPRGPGGRASSLALSRLHARRRVRGAGASSSGWRWASRPSPRRAGARAPGARARCSGSGSRGCRWRSWPRPAARDGARGGLSRRDVALANARAPRGAAAGPAAEPVRLAPGARRGLVGRRASSARGCPYFLSLYLGPLALALAAVGAFALPRRAAPGRCSGWRRSASGTRSASAGGLASLVARLPLAPRSASRARRCCCRTSRWPWPRLRRRPAARRERAWAPLAAVGGRRGRGGAGGRRRAGRCARRPASAWSGRRSSPSGRRLVDGGAARRGHRRCCSRSAAAARGLGRARAGVLRSGSRPSPCVVALAVADLARAGAGLNRAGAPVLLRAAAGDGGAAARATSTGGRVFSYGLDHSPAFREFLARGGPELTLAASSCTGRCSAPTRTCSTASRRRRRRTSRVRAPPARAASRSSTTRRASATSCPGCATPASRAC